MDMTTTTVPKSDQINAEDVMMSGPITVTVESVDEGGAEQPVNVHLVEYPRRAYRPSKSMRRVMVKAWGKESDGYTGHRMTLYYDPDVKFGGVRVGGIKISHVSHITKRLEMALTETKGKRALHTVDPLTDTASTKPARKAAEATPDVTSITDRDVLTRMWKAAPRDSAERAAIEARVAELNTNPAPADDGPSDADWDAMGATS